MSRGIGVHLREPGRREFAFSFLLETVPPRVATKEVPSDVCKAFIGLVVSVDLARGLSALVEGRPVREGPASMAFILILNGLLIPVGLFLARKDRAASVGPAFSLAAAAAAFFTFPTS